MIIMINLLHGCVLNTVLDDMISSLEFIIPSRDADIADFNIFHRTGSNGVETNIFLDLLKYSETTPNCDSLTYVKCHFLVLKCLQPIERLSIGHSAAESPLGRA